MVNQEVIDFIKKSKVAGYSDEQIKSALMANSWQEIDIDEAFKSINITQTNYPNAIYENTQDQPLILRYAGFWIRFLAGFIDTLPFLIIALVFNRSLGEFSYIIYVILMTKIYQATLGKMAMGIKVVSENSENLTWGQVILREIVGKFVSGIIFNIGFIMVGFTERKQGLHDKIAKTLVISTRS